MKECPICHTINDDKNECCKNCHVSLDFKVYNLQKNDNIQNEQKDYAVNQNTVIKYFDLVGTNEYKNNLRLLQSGTTNCNNHNLRLQINENVNNTEIAVFADELKIGYISSDKINLFKLKDASYNAKELFINNSGDDFTARILVVFHRIIDSTDDKKKSYKSCMYCGDKTNRDDRDGLCEKCAIKKVMNTALYCVFAFFLQYYIVIFSPIKSFFTLNLFCSIIELVLLITLIVIAVKISRRIFSFPRNGNKLFIGNAISIIIIYLLDVFPWICYFSDTFMGVFCLFILVLLLLAIFLIHISRK